MTVPANSLALRPSPAARKTSENDVATKYPAESELCVPVGGALCLVKGSCVRLHPSLCRPGSSGVAASRINYAGIIVRFITVSYDIIGARL